MGRGRKTGTLSFKEKSHVPPTVKFRSPARNLTKDGLAAVIFGCKHRTFFECLDKKLCGLPASHYSYVKNVTPGLLLFLFNYSDRTLHGIFKAMSCGETNIDQHAWITSEGTETSPYPAQVRVDYYKTCQPLLEKHFKPIIAKNYYTDTLFWFELDKKQTERLVELFLSSPLPKKSPCPPNAPRWNNMVEVFPSSEVDDAADEDFKNLGTQEYSRIAEMKLKENEHSYTSASYNRDAFAPEKKWTDLFKTCHSSSVVKNGDAWESDEVRLHTSMSDCSDMEREFASSSHEMSKPPPEACPDVANKHDSNVAECREEHAFVGNDVEEKYESKTSLQYHEQDNDGPDLTDVPDSDAANRCASSVVECWEEHDFVGNDVEEKYESRTSLQYHEQDNDGPDLTDVPDSDAANRCASSVVECWEEHDFVGNDVEEKYESRTSLQYHEQDNDRPDLKDVPDSEYRTLSDGDGDELKPSGFNSVVDMEPEEALSNSNEKERSTNAFALVENCERDHNLPNSTERAFSETSNVLSRALLTNIQSSNFESVITKLMQEIEELKATQLRLEQKLDSLEHELVHSKLDINELTKRCHKVESMPSSACDQCNREDQHSPNLTTEGSVFIVGGFDGSSWHPDLSLYSPSTDNVMPICPMTFSRSYASVAKLNGEIYILGGVHDGVWYDSVESYNPISKKWVQRPCLNHKKGSLAGVSMYQKIFAIGGGNRVKCFSEVELFDVNTGGWISTQSMLEKCFALAAADINGSIYVTGGYDGRDYLCTVERFDPREHGWRSLGNMNTKRGCHSLVAFKEKLYAIGGYDGDTMVSTVEVYDPRFGLWMMDQPMTVSRGYFGSFVFGGKIYVTGGVKDNEVFDVVECYEEDSGWQTSGLKAVGKRTFFSTVVL